MDPVENGRTKGSIDSVTLGGDRFGRGFVAERRLVGQTQKDEGRRSAASGGPSSRVSNVHPISDGTDSKGCSRARCAAAPKREGTIHELKTCGLHGGLKRFSQHLSTWMVSVGLVLQVICNDVLGDLYKESHSQNVANQSVPDLRMTPGTLSSNYPERCMA